MNVILGAGMVGMPMVLSKLGYFGFVASLSAVAVYGIFAINILLKACAAAKSTSYEDVAHKAFGMAGKAYTSTVIFMSCMFAMCSYMFIVKTNGPALIQGILGIEGNCAAAAKTYWYLNDTTVVLIVIWLVVFPLTLPRNVDFLGFTSGLGMVSMVGFALIIISFTWNVDCPIAEAEMAKKFLVAMNHSKHDPTCNITNVFAKHAVQFYDMHKTQECVAEAFIWTTASIQKIPTIVFAFQFHAGALPVYNELPERTIPNMMKVAALAVFAVFAIYGSVSLAAYFTWYNLTMESVLMMYSALSADDPRILLARSAILICVIFSAPLLHYTCRVTQIKVFQEPGSNPEFDPKRHYGWALINMVVLTLVVLFAEGIEVMFAYGGAVTANSIVIILPAMFYWKLIEQPLARKTGKKGSLYYVCPAIAVFGLVMMAFMIYLRLTTGTPVSDAAPNATTMSALVSNNH